MAALHQAQARTEPTVGNYWHEIARGVAGKSADQCFEKFFGRSPEAPAKRRARATEAPSTSSAQARRWIREAGAGGLRPYYLWGGGVVRRWLGGEFESGKNFRVRSFEPYNVGGSWWTSASPRRPCSYSQVVW